MIDSSLEKPHILISSIVRNREEYLSRYFNQIESFIKKLNHIYDFSISIYENDSTDNSKDILKSYSFSSFKNNFIKCENIGTQYFHSVVSDQRVVNYANARNKTIEGLDLSMYRWILIIEPDVIYTPEMMCELILQMEVPETPDIYSGVLITENRAYDTWGMRRFSFEEWGDFFPDYLENPVKEFWSTANGICIYNSKPFILGLKFNAFNKRFNKYDCDSAVLCEDFRSMGFDKIYVNQLIQPIHE